MALNSEQSQHVVYCCCCYNYYDHYYHYKHHDDDNDYYYYYFLISFSPQRGTLKMLCCQAPGVHLDPNCNSLNKRIFFIKPAVT